VSLRHLLRQKPEKGIDIPMSNKLTVLTVKNHNRLRFQPVADYSHTRTTTQSPLLASEVYAASFSYPIVFPASGTIIPQALLSTHSKENPQIDATGSWKGGYLPLHFRRFPFFLGREKNSDKAVILFDESAPQLNENEGKLLYNKQGEGYTASPLLLDIKQSLQNFDEEYQRTKALCTLLKNSGVLTEAGLSVTREGKIKKVGGFSVVDWQKVQLLEDNVLANWARIGLIQLIHSHLQSLKQNGIQLPKPNADKVPEAQTKASKKPAASKTKPVAKSKAKTSTKSKTKTTKK
jgi:hypothetical protein